VPDGERAVNRMDLQGKVAIVTGSSSGIGESVARALASAGVSVVVNSSTSVAAGEAVAASLPDAIYVQGNITDEEACRALAAAATERFGRLDILVNNAATTTVIPHADLDAATDEVWREIFEVNVLGTWHMTRAAVPALRASGAGSVLNVSSVAGVRHPGPRAGT
jgi:ketoreductase RED2